MFYGFAISISAYIWLWLLYPHYYLLLWWGRRWGWSSCETKWHFNRHLCLLQIFLIIRLNSFFLFKEVIVYIHTWETFYDLYIIYFSFCCRVWFGSWRHCNNGVMKLYRFWSPLLSLLEVCWREVVLLVSLEWLPFMSSFCRFCVVGGRHLFSKSLHKHNPTIHIKSTLGASITLFYSVSLRPFHEISHVYHERIFTMYILCMR